MSSNKYVELQDENQSSTANQNNNVKRNTQIKTSMINFQKNHQIMLENFDRIFDQDNIRDGVSSKILSQMGGILQLAKQLDVNLEYGINTKDKKSMEMRKRYFGQNLPIILPPKTFFQLIYEQFEDATLRILLLATIASLVIGLLKDLETGWFEGVAILVAVFIIVNITATNDYIKEKQFQKLNSKQEDRQIEVVRNGQLEKILTSQLLVGDILILKTNETLPVDGILTTGYKIKTDESQMTGEAELIHKSVAPRYQVPFSPRDGTTPFILSGSKIMDGAGQLLICAVGKNTSVGKLKLKLLEEQPPTPLQIKLEGVANDIGTIGIICAAMTVLVLVVYLVIDIFRGKVNNTTKILDRLIGFVMIGITIIVMAVPEGLPLAVTIALAFSLGKMRDDNNLVKQLHSCETMGGANNICSDKTGTLTENKMTATHCFIEESDRQMNKAQFLERIRQQTLKLFCEGICINSNATPQIVKTKDGKDKFQHQGNPTECALLEFVNILGFDYNKYRPTQRIRKQIPFSSKRKKMTTIYYDETKNVHLVYCKGASEIILESCVALQGKMNQIPLNAHKRKEIKDKVIDTYGGSSLRVIALAYKEIYDDLTNYTDEQFEENLILIAIVGIQDPLRKGIYAAVQQCKNAGITVRMVTGDNLITACAIAKEAGILEKNFDPTQPAQPGNEFKVLEGKKFRALVGGLVYEDPKAKNKKGDEEEQKDQTDQIKKQAKVVNIEMFNKIAAQLKVLARSTPDDKFILVTGLIQTKNVVAVTGDGTNDAPALKKADVGFAMGIAGTEVAKEAAGIILLDDNFASIVNACKWGRNIYDCIRKFIQFQLTVNVVALTMAFIGACTEKQSPITPIQMLWVNLIMDTFASLALATEPPNDDQLKQKPYKRDESMITPNMWRNIIGQSIYQIFILCTILYYGPSILNIYNSFNMKKFDPHQATHLTIFFNTFVFMQIFNQLNARKLKRYEINIFKGFFNNPMFFVIELIEVGVQILLVEFGGQFVSCTDLSLKHHLICIGLGSGSLIVTIIIKIMPDFIFNKIKLFQSQPEISPEEAERKQSQMDGDLVSSVKRKFSQRTSFIKQESKMKSFT